MKLNTNPCAAFREMYVHTRKYNELWHGELKRDRSRVKITLLIVHCPYYKEQKFQNYDIQGNIIILYVFQTKSPSEKKRTSSDIMKVNFQKLY